MGNGMSCCTKDNLIFKVVDVSKLNSTEPKKLNKREGQLLLQQSRPFDESTLSNNLDGKSYTMIHQVHSSTELSKLSNPLSLHHQENTEENDPEIYQRPKKNQTEKFDLKKLMPHYKKSTTSVAESSLRPFKSMKSKKDKSLLKQIEVINEILNEKQINLIKSLLFQGSDLFDQIGESTK